MAGGAMYCVDNDLCYQWVDIGCPLVIYRSRSDPQQCQPPVVQSSGDIGFDTGAEAYWVGGAGGWCCCSFIFAIFAAASIQSVLALLGPINLAVAWYFFTTRQTIN